MAKTIYVVRHAKSSWADLTMTDKDRPLNKRGQRDAPIMASYCALHGYKPDRMITSTAVRASTTASHFAEVLEIDPVHYMAYDSLYHAPAQTYIETCYQLGDEVSSVMLFGHNPGITYLANEVATDFIDNVPTCGVLVIDYSGDSWQSIDVNQCSLRTMITPKSIANE